METFPDAVICKTFNLSLSASLRTVIVPPIWLNFDGIFSIRFGALFGKHPGAPYHPLFPGLFIHFVQYFFPDTGFVSGFFNGKMSQCFVSIPAAIPMFPEWCFILGLCGTLFRGGITPRLEHGRQLGLERGEFVVLTPQKGPWPQSQGWLRSILPAKASPRAPLFDALYRKLF